MSDLTVPAEAYEAALDAARAEHNSRTRLAPAGPDAIIPHYVVAYARAAVDAVWPLAVAEGRRAFFVEMFGVTPEQAAATDQAITDGTYRPCGEPDDLAALGRLRDDASYQRGVAEGRRQAAAETLLSAASFASLKGVPGVWSPEHNEAVVEWLLARAQVAEGAVSGH